MLHKTALFLFGADPKLRRLLLYWAGAAALYLLSVVVLYHQVSAGTVSAEGARNLSCFAIAGALVFLVLVRFSVALGIAPYRLAVLQALFAFVCNIGAYALLGEVRGASLMIMLVVMVFCTFSLRPRATLGLCGAAIGMLGLSMAVLSSRAPLVFTPRVELMHFLLASCCLFAVTLLTGAMSRLRASLKAQKSELQVALGQIRTLATVDELTSLANRRYMNEVLADQERRAPVPDAALCIALLDIDFFKNVNDRFGHDGGDSVLRTFAAAARAELRVGDLLARWGGEEFLLMLPDTSVTEALPVLKRMAERVRAVDVPGVDMERDLTFSAGLVERGDDEPFAETISRADRAMYAAKGSGRDRVVSA
ncbi:diguanylate cyclase [Massilia sp. TSP1-1-2]|uniref:diguanylate cyclase n=1 Tax=unclassified Massilia TaxID=2609279 RepID=UPI003CF65513